MSPQRSTRLVSKIAEDRFLPLWKTMFWKAMSHVARSRTTPNSRCCECVCRRRLYRGGGYLVLPFTAPLYALPHAFLEYVTYMPQFSAFLSLGTEVPRVGILIVLKNGGTQAYWIGCSDR